MSILINKTLRHFSVINGTNYYVKTGGNDSSDGLSDTTAWAHHPWMSTWTGSTVLVAGDVVNMKRGDTWSISSPVAAYMTVAQSGSEGKPITTTAYGTGADPIIKIATASDQVVILADEKAYITFDNLHIQHHSSTFAAGRHGIFLDGSTNPCHDFIFINNEIDDIPSVALFAYSNAYNITVGNTDAIATATSTVYNNHIHDFGYAGIILEGVDAVSGHSHFDVYNNYIHDATPTTTPNYGYGIMFTCSVPSTAWPVYATARFNRVENINTWEGLDTHGGSYIYFQDNFVKQFGSCGVVIQGVDDGAYPAFTADHIYVERNIFEQPSSGWVTGSEDSFISVYSASATEVLTDIYIRDNIVRFSTQPAGNLFTAIRIAPTDGIVVSGNTISGALANTNPGIYLYTDGIGNENVTISENFINWVNTPIKAAGDQIIGVLNIHNNIIIGSYPIAFGVAQIDAAADIKIYNNTLAATARPISLDYGCAAGSSVDIKNNLITIPNNASQYYIDASGTFSGTVAFDYNLYWNSSSANPFNWAGSARNWAYWTGTAGFEGNSPNSDESEDPLFTNGSGLYNLVTDFALGIGSPAINTGTNTGITTDFYGNARVGNYDIGAIEVQ